MDTTRGGGAAIDTSLCVGARIEVPQNAFAADVPLVAVMRGPYVGSLHRGSVAVADSSGRLVLAAGDPEQPVFLRSAAKPFQVMPALLTGAIDRFDITAPELAVLCASHNAEERHTRAVLSALGKAGLGETALRCGTHPPLHEATAAGRLRSGIAPSPVCNNCSGAHAGMLLACQAAGWPLDTYGEAAHPLQRMTRQVLGTFAGRDPAGIEYAVDNCAVPTFRLPLAAAARAFARLATGSGVTRELADAAGRVVAAMTAHPEMVAGEERFDTDLMLAAGGMVVAKGGAEGFQGIGLTRSGLGAAIKISDGNARAVPPAAMRVLQAVGGLDLDSALARFVEPEVRNHNHELVGRLVPVFQPGGKE